MVLIFLRDWRSALIVVMNIPFALFDRRDSAVGHGPDDQHHDAWRSGAGGRGPGGRGDGFDREYPHPDAFQAFRRARAVLEASQPDGDRATAGDVVHSGRIRSVVLHDRCEPAAFCSVVAGRCILDDCVLRALQHWFRCFRRG